MLPLTERLARGDASPPRWSITADAVLRALGQSAPSTARKIAGPHGDGHLVGHRLQTLREQGLVTRTAQGPPAKWSLTPSGQDRYRRLCLGDLRARANRRRTASLTQIAAAEDLWRFADCLTTAASPRLSPSRSDVALTFRAVVEMLAAHVGEQVLVSIDAAATWPLNPGVTIIGPLHELEVETTPIDAGHCDDLDKLVKVPVGDSGVVTLSRRHFSGAVQKWQGSPGDLVIRQGALEIEIWFGA